MGKKEAKTNAIRILETMKIPYEARTYECDDFVDAAQIADKLGLDHAGMYKTITTVGKSGGYYVGTGFQSNVGIISALVGRHDYVICDRENHASIYAGCQLSYGKMLRYRHSDMAELEKCMPGRG